MALCLVVSGCAVLGRPATESAPSVAEELFDRGVAELSSRGETTFFETLAREYPDSPWASRARAVLGLREGAVAEGRGALEAELSGRDEELAGARAERDRLESERGELAGELDRVRTDNESLLRDLEELKNLTIEMELKR